MKVFCIFSRPLRIAYKHQICSLSFLFVLCIGLLTMSLPLLIIYMTNGRLWKTQLILYEQPRTQFDHDYVLIAKLSPLEPDGEEKTVVCSSYAKFTALSKNSEDCSSVEVSFFYYFSTTSL